ncbi:hypothetical protein D3C85_1315950 [compost metagenome]
MISKIFNLKYKSNRKRCSSLSIFKSRFVAAMRRKLDFFGIVSPIGINSLVSRTRSNLACNSIGISPISSRNKVPSLASSINPLLSFIAPVNAPCLCPNNSLSNISLLKVLQFKATNDFPARLLFS